MKDANTERNILAEARKHLQIGQQLQFSDPADYAGAEECFRKVTELAPNWAEGYLWMGAVLKRSGKSSEARLAFETAISLDPTDPRPLVSLGWLLSGMGEYERAVEFLRKGIELKPSYGEADAYNMLAETHERQGQIEKAIAIWRKVAVMTPTYPSGQQPIQEAVAKLAIHDKA